MSNPVQVPESLMEAIEQFADPGKALAFAAAMRWPEGVVCPYCGSGDDLSFLKTRRIWKCLGCRKQFSVKVGTIFEDSPIPLNKWLCAMWMLASCKNGVSSCEIARDLRVTQKTAWFMFHRLRLCMRAGSFDRKLAGTIEADESFIGGAARNMHREAHDRKITGRGPSGKAIVMALVERHGEVRTAVMPSRKKGPLQSFVKGHVAPGSEVFTDELKSYNGLNTEYAHKVINHAESYVEGTVHTNNAENFWSLLKRTLGGTYVSVEPYHLFRYLDEQSFRYNHRHETEASRFVRVCSAIVGRRITYNQLIGQDA
jgi:transposase-like protein